MKRRDLIRHLIDHGCELILTYRVLSFKAISKFIEIQARIGETSPQSTKRVHIQALHHWLGMQCTDRAVASTKKCCSNGIGRLILNHQEASSICAGHSMDSDDFRWIKDFRSRQSCHDSLRPYSRRKVLSIKIGHPKPVCNYPPENMLRPPLCCGYTHGVTAISVQLEAEVIG